MKYIDADALIEIVNSALGRKGIVNAEKTAYLYALSVLTTAKPADVAPVVHGRNLAPLSLFDCSVCGWSCGDTCHGDTETYNFCPNCGAKMDVLYQK